MVEQNNELLIKNHASHPIGSAPFPKLNVTSFNYYGRGHDRERGRDCHNYRNCNNYANHYSNNKNIFN